MNRMILAAALMLAFAGPSLAIDRETGSLRSVYIEKGTFAASLSGGYNQLGASGLDDATQYSLFGLIENVKGDLTVYDVHAGLSWFFADNFAAVFRVGYSSLDVNLDSSSILNTEINNKHITRPRLTVAAGSRAYLPLFNSKVVAMFCEGRLTGSLGSSKSYADSERGKEGTYNDINQFALGFYPGVSMFLTNNLAVEVSLPMLEGGYLQQKQFDGQEPTAKAFHGYVNFKPNFLKMNLGVVLHF